MGSLLTGAPPFRLTTSAMWVALSLVGLTVSVFHDGSGYGIVLNIASLAVWSVCLKWALRGAP